MKWEKTSDSYDYPLAIQDQHGIYQIEDDMVILNSSLVQRSITQLTRNSFFITFYKIWQLLLTIHNLCQYKFEM